MFRTLIAASLATIPVAAWAQTAAPVPRMAPAEAMQLIDAAGFKVVGGHPQNRCGHAVNPRVAFTDLNGDGRPEAHIADVDPGCYAKPGAYYAILTRNDAGHWGRMIAEDAIASFDKTRTDGWIDIEVKPGNGNCPGVRHHVPYAYLTPCVAGAGGASASEAAPAANPAAARGARGYPTDGWKIPVSFAALPAADQDAIMRAAGLTRSGTVWKGCEGLSEADAKSVEIKDLNHDGRPEAIVTDSGMCYGNTGQEFTILRATPGGWAQMMQVTGIPIYLKARGTDGYPDVMIGMPGTCFGVDRWNGSEYKYIGSRYDSKDPDTAKPCKP
ncbi:hypothetical protein DFR49_1679 [Hephaestia caeni]|uniref:VCBS repeat protein n=1 Tax=Hephaestia caeni TaxID=645617 RepID=A0A397PMZ9_9SPHN|nr:hypothetical protein [Hephaestia caeni]RIA47111.1 hypothetical protein DFR49_1679 [Hephaestia caeni]